MARVENCMIAIKRIVRCVIVLKEWNSLCDCVSELRMDILAFPWKACGFLYSEWYARRP